MKWGYHHLRKHPGRAWFFYTLPENKENSEMEVLCLHGWLRFEWKACFWKKKVVEAKMFYFHPENWGSFPFWLNIFQMGWFNHQLEPYFFHIIWAWNRGILTFRLSLPWTLETAGHGVSSWYRGHWITYLGDGIKTLHWVVVAIHFLFSSRPIWGNDPSWLIFFQMGWFNHQLVQVHGSFWFAFSRKVHEVWVRCFMMPNLLLDKNFWNFNLRSVSFEGEKGIWCWRVAKRLVPWFGFSDRLKPGVI